MSIIIELAAGPLGFILAFALVFWAGMWWVMREHKREMDKINEEIRRFVDDTAEKSRRRD